MKSKVIESYDKFLRSQEKKIDLYPDREKLYRSIVHHMETKGKLLRPVIMATVNRDLNNDYESIERFALSLELIHNYSLIHDDLPAMDDDDYRRGIPTIHKLYNDGIAVLAGDYLLAEAFQVLTSDEYAFINNSQSYIKAINFFSRYINDLGMLGGQVIDIDPENINNREDLLDMYELKTAALFKIAFVIPGILTGRSSEYIQMLEDIGKYFGLYFQIKDDIDDREEDSKIGKKTIFSFFEEDEIDGLLKKYEKTLLTLLNSANLNYTLEFIEGLV